MSDLWMILLFSLLLIVGFGVIMVYTFREITRISGASLRSVGVERRDFFQILERMFEKRDSSNPMATAQVHRDERMHQVAQDTKVAEAAVTDKKPISELGRDELFAEPNEMPVQGGDGEPLY